MNQRKKPSLVRASWKNDLKIIVALFLARRGFLFLLAIFADKFLPYAPSFPYAYYIFPLMNLPRWLYSFANFDGVHYLTIASQGYLFEDYIQAFFPLYPAILIRSLHEFTGINPLLLGLMISNVAFLAFLFVWKRFITKLYGDRVAWCSLIALLIFPTSFFFGALYTESLFLLFVMLAFQAAYSKHWYQAALWTALASGTRVTGVLLVPAILTEMWVQKEWNWKNVFKVLLGTSGLLAYMAFLQNNFKDPLLFSHVQAAFGAGRDSKLILYPQVLFRSIKILLTARPFDWKYFAYVQEFIAGAGGLIALAFAAKKVRASFSVFALLSFLLPTLTGTFSSMPRYLLTCFPLFILIGWFAQKHPRRMILWWIVSAVLLVINTLLFIQGYWVA
jgi:hypothetical protein